MSNFLQERVNSRPQLVFRGHRRILCLRFPRAVLQNSEVVSSAKEVLSDFKKSMSDDLATIFSRISSLEAGHRVSLPTPCEEVSDLISMAPGSQEATFRLLKSRRRR
jgi:hypothetical protein